ncbi:exodeoxyribonuclease VII large subunit [Rhodalgimonas zhirmunskyi]|uniref:Exodeoxyribonuclease 7 large subunit n=1 Tax=Rhodalgimonas zhirmunskyi TaxID=2964767 RepID=A0AAJ1U930_9RHOB|nr:exodeoxyribonuclease VII large subunit [Rhodoalgimonas zhirmunskyi]MDQ2093528.1 exodeoxyribonuclease VII large subunit [Rhodoalgimonas zhirmunskyi]
MSDLIDDPSPGLNDPEFSVTELSNAIKRVIEGEFGHVRIRGEVGRVSRPRSGHVYLDLKDDKSVINGVIWKGVASRLQIQPEEGMEVVATGRLTTFGGQSRYQIVIEDMKPAGMGALMAMLEKRKAALAAEGLFAPERKKKLPYLPEIIGVVTSPSGAVIRDILHRLRDRFPRKVLIWPVAVQGDRCAAEVANAINGFNALESGGRIPRPDLLIVARGGGSIEDLWGFNEEIVARAAAASTIPLISAVGHETDTTLIDYVSDRRAPTPTAAAEIAVPVRHELLATLEGQGARMAQALSLGVASRGQRLRDLARALPRPEGLLDGPRQRLDRAGERLPAALQTGVSRRRVHLSEVSGPLRPNMLRARLGQASQRLALHGPRLASGLTRAIERKRDALDRRTDRLDIERVEREVKRRRERFRSIEYSLSEAGRRQTMAWRDHLTALARLRDTLGYKATLKRGYAVVRGDGDLVTTAKQAAKAGALEIQFQDARLTVGDGTASKAESQPAQKKPARKPAPKPAPKPKKDSPDQGSLF